LKNRRGKDTAPATGLKFPDILDCSESLHLEIELVRARKEFVLFAVATEDAV
jgi:hypothetical protein